MLNKTLTNYYYDFFLFFSYRPNLGFKFMILFLYICTLLLVIHVGYNIVLNFLHSLLKFPMLDCKHAKQLRDCVPGKTGYDGNVWFWEQNMFGCESRICVVLRAEYVWLWEQDVCGCERRICLVVRAEYVWLWKQDIWGCENRICSDLKTRYVWF